MGGHASRKALPIIAAFQHGNEAAVADAIGHLHQLVGQPGKILGVPVEAGQRIAMVGIEAGRDQQEIRLEGLDGGEDALDIGGTHGAGAAAGGQGGVDDIADADEIRIAGARIERHLVARGIEHRAVVLENVLGAIAVMDVEIDDGDAACAKLALCFTGDDRDRVDEAEAHRPAALGMVAGRADGAEGISRFAQGDSFQRGKAGAEGGRGSVEGAGRDKGVFVDPAYAFGGAGAGEDAQVAFVMHQLGQRQVAVGGVAALEGIEAGCGQRFLDGAQPIGPFRMAGRGHVAFEIALRNEERCHVCLWNDRQSLTLPRPACQTTGMSEVPKSPDLSALAARLRAGELVAFPTETVYGLGADATSSDAVLKIYETKGRPRFNPLIVHVADLPMAERLVEFSPLARQLAVFWPGPLTLVLPRRADAGLSDIVTAGLDTVGIRIPDHELARDLIRATGRPLAAPSANRSGKLSPTTAAQVRRSFGDAVPVLDGGAAQAGVESTILAVEGETVTQLRAGALPREVVEEVIGIEVAQAAHDAKVTAPGMLLSHYAPEASLRLDADRPEAGETWLGFGPGPEGVNLSPSGDLREAARNLFSMLHALDETAARIAVARIPHTGLGEAINDRLKRAAAPRG